MERYTGTGGLMAIFRIRPAGLAIMLLPEIQRHIKETRDERHDHQSSHRGQQRQP